MDEKPLTRRQIYYREHREEELAKAKERRLRNHELFNARSRESKHKDWNAYLSKNNATNRRLHAELKAKAIVALGGRCACCGYNADIRALQIDHINSDGFEERERTGNNQWMLYKSVAENGGQGRYQCLCANCNQIKRMEAKEHPRKRKRSC